MTLEEFALDLDCCEELMRSMESCQNYRNELLACKPSRSITKIVCFGLGTLSHVDPFWRTRSLLQTAMVIVIMEVLGHKLKKTAAGGGGAIPVPCFSQDPAYSDLDKEFLASRGITVLEDPKGFLEVDENTLVIALAPAAPVRQVIADLQWPGAMIARVVEEGSEMVLETEMVDGVEHPL
ncbi:hypothetical protein K402DRAFT_382610 [Aulographum hederae CBS 113979]|uniref:SRR1-like domain-containing protein n=1 Tax=Aulographum hederae CBS 113979 TaxID=1176131 RepID=A0A6G1GRE2_9PEZI|nr:hypothetical protein K402DRAFT_382610 [Aulographum hederae CBS 113979]